MSGWMGLAVLCVAAAAALALSTALSFAASLPLSGPLLERWAMAGRLRSLVVVSALPALIAGSLLAICFGPSLLSSTGLVGDHCFRHIDHQVHLCIQHLPSIAPSGAIGALVALGMGGAALIVGRALRLTLRGRQTVRSLAWMATRREDVRWLDSPVAVSLTAGLLRPQVYLSSGMAARLSATELAAAVAHEHCHARERHGLWKLLAASLGSLHLPGVRRRLLELVDLACERRADEAAAARVGDRVHVASAIVRAHRVAPDLASPLVLALSRGGHNLSLRVRALLDDEVASAPASHRWALAAIAALLASSHAIHHGVEHVLSLLV